MMICVRKVQFSDAPVGDMHVQEPMYVNDDGKLVDPCWRDINYFQATHNLKLMQVVTIEQGAYKRPILVGIFEGDEWQDL